MRRTSTTTGERTGSCKYRDGNSCTVGCCSRFSIFDGSVRNSVKKKAMNLVKTDDFELNLGLLLVFELSPV